MVSDSSSGTNHIGKKSHLTENTKYNGTIMERMFPWLQSDSNTRISIDTKHDKIATKQAKSFAQQTNLQEKKQWLYILEKV